MKWFGGLKEKVLSCFRALVIILIPMILFVLPNSLLFFFAKGREQQVNNPFGDNARNEPENNHMQKNPDEKPQSFFSLHDSQMFAQYKPIIDKQPKKNYINKDHQEYHLSYLPFFSKNFPSFRLLP